MAKVVYLEKAQSPPDDEDWVLVTKLPSGKFQISSTIQVGPEGVRFANSVGQNGSLAPVLKLAIDYADQVGVGTIYVHANGTEGTDRT